MELLSPAKNLEVGIAAISHGADAVYIGAPRFGARSAAANTINEIEQLVKYAHLYNSKVYVALNTILKDEELDLAQTIILQLYNIGVDAIIIQDMGITMLDLPPISLHASTQCDVRTLEKVQFLEKCGFEQVVLARETSLDTMRHIAANTNVKLETFVHGALCVSYSGQCYMSQNYTGRSANRGECAQMCRLPYNLMDEQGNILRHNKHLLSLKDFDASSHLKAMIDMGIHSFKIEGRLKDIEYVKNITAYYRQRLDNILTEKGQTPRYIQSYSFAPDPKKTFYRGATDYFLQDRNTNITSFDTPKSMGEPIGKVRDLWRNALSLDTTEKLTNGDGLCYLDKKGEFQGFRVNKVEESGRVLPLKMPDIEKGTMLYRNHNEAFEKSLNNNSAQRLIPLDFLLSETSDGINICAKDIDGNEVSYQTPLQLEEAKNADKAKENTTTQLSKLGGTCFTINNITFDFTQQWFLPASIVAEWRRQLVDELQKKRVDNYQRAYIPVQKDSTHPYITDTIDYHTNIYNEKAKQFYTQHGVHHIEMAYEHTPITNAELMRCRHCIRYSIGQCHRHSPNPTIPMTTQLYLENSRGRYQLHFDCHNCEMTISM